MSIFYKRTEDEKSITITFRYRIVPILAVIVMIIFYGIASHLENSIIEKVIIIPCIIAILYSSIETIKPGIELRKYMKKQEVKVSGAIYSFKNPTKYEITK